jgi:hypothetical protein
MPNFSSYKLISQIIFCVSIHLKKVISLFKKKNTMIHLLMALFLLYGFKNYIDNCKLDLDLKNKINNNHNVAWRTVIFETPIGASMIDASDNRKSQMLRIANAH